ncbi:PAS domain S-box protein [Oculatella sp. LEGE 06141]|uniref:PAS domain S-box protein n=1 Tax=Oculatella sp. LEGE 06141 TaxID=1828648 RepID=UPI001882EDAE|nr:PAS domain S-box protein [Oculatella sp. LEGE 06141]MBE9180372.1 PAS domain S-box protein [Oculatella sp. LEGE 06141]
MSLLWQLKQDSIWIDADPLEQSVELDAAELRVLERLHSPIWIYDIQNSRMWWVNRAALPLWNAASQEELLHRDFSDTSEAVQTLLLSYLQQFEQGKTITESWTLYPQGGAVTLRCVCSGVRIDGGRLAMLVEGTTPIEQIQPDLVRSLAAVRQTRGLMSLFSMDGTPLLQNPAAIRCYGNLDTTHALDSLLAQSHPFLHRFVDRDVGQHMLTTVSAEQTCRLEAQVITLQGIRWHDIDAQLIHDPIAGETSILVNEKDITERKRAELAIRQREQQLELLFARSLDGFFFMMLDEPVQWDDSVDKDQALNYVFAHQRITEANHALLAQYGAEQEQLIGRTPGDFFACNLAYSKALWRQLFDRGQLHFYNQTQRLDGTPIWVEGNYTCLYDSQKRIMGHFGIQRDVTERQQAEEALKHSESRFRSIVSNLLGAVYRSRAEDNFSTVFFSETVEELTGYPVSLFMNDPSFTIFNITHPDDLAATEEIINQSLAAGQPYTLEFRIIRADGEVRWLFEKGQGAYDTAGNLVWIDGVLFDVTDRRQMEEALKTSEIRYRSLTENTADAIYLIDADFDLVYYNPAIETIFGRPREYFYINRPQSFLDCIHPDDVQNVTEAFFVAAHRHDLVEVNYRIIRPDGEIRYVRDALHVIRDEWGTIQSYQGIISDVTTLKQSEAALRQQAERESLIQAIAQNIRDSLDLHRILDTTVCEIRTFLQADRVVIYGYESASSVRILVEAATEDVPSMLHWQGQNSLFTDEAWINHYRQGQHQICSDIEQGGIPPEAVDLAEQYQIRAMLIVPIGQGENLWGLLVAHQCHNPRQWQPSDIELLQQIAVQTRIGIQQAELYQQVQKLNTNLEQEVQDRTVQLQQVLNFEALLKRITDRVRDSLDEHQIVQTAVSELVQGLSLSSCDTALFSDSEESLQIIHECTVELATFQGATLAFSEISDILPQLSRGECLQFCELFPRPYSPHWKRSSILASPIFDDQGVLGDLWLFRATNETFSELEIRLVQQVSNQCAIAIRQARLFQATQTQVEELERLNGLKDDFLSTVSHELRTPMSSIKLAIEMLELRLQPLGLLTAESSSTSRYFQVLKNECHREITLINDLLDLSRLAAGTEPLILTQIDLTHWISSLMEPFYERVVRQQQSLDLHLTEASLSITTDLSYLERVLTELLTNACKYTPLDGQIEVAVKPNQTGVQIRVSNSGVEISAVERDRIFEKFYRIPNNDPWKHGGTGLGLALVKKILEQLHGSIEVQSEPGWTHFLVQLPSL